MRIAFLGSGAFGLPTIEYLAAHHELAAIVTQPDRPAGRRKALTPTPIAEWADRQNLSRDIAIFKPERINEESTRNAIRAIDADTWVVIAFGQYLSTGLIADRFVVNLHGSRLPRWRGAAPIHHAIIAGDRTTGNSVITIARSMDAGDVLAMSERAIEPTATTGDLHDALASDGPALIERVLKAREAGSETYTPQDESLVTMAPKLTREMATVDFANDADTVRARINGLSPWPGIAASIAGRRIKLVRAAPADAGDPNAPPGTLIDARAGMVACASNQSVCLLEVQPAGKGVMPWEAFYNGATPNNGEGIDVQR